MLDILYYILYTFFVALYVYVIFVILMENRNPIKTLAWIMLMMIVPMVGVLLFLIVGRNYRRTKLLIKRTGRVPKPKSNIYDFDKLSESGVPIRFQKLIRLLNSNSGSRLSVSNDVEVYAEGSAIFNSLYADIERAESHIHLQFYIIENDSEGDKLQSLLKKKADEGVEVRVLYDFLGGWRLPTFWKQDLRQANVEIHSYNSFKNLFGFFMMNYRNHRKLVIIDGKIGYTGGVNLAERYRIGNELGDWRDTFIRISGEAVHEMQYSFLFDWNFVTGTRLRSIKYYPKIDATGDKYIQIVTSSPDDEWENIMHGIINAINNAHSTIYIHSPYYMAPESIMVALVTAALSGVDVRLLVPEHNDSRLVAAASRSYFSRLLAGGVRVFLYQKNFLHSKAIVIDKYISVIGTANMDTRSFEQNFEISAFIYDEQTAEKLHDEFINDLSISRELNYNLWLSRPKIKKVKESIARLFSPIL
ncbi:MAG: cardiolipin synthase [bacterium]